MADKPFFALELEDYAVGIFCTGRKVYFATLEDMHEFIPKLEATGKDPSVVQAFREFENGDPDAKYVFLGERRLMNPAQLLCHSVLYINSKVFSLSDEIGYPYDYQIVGGSLHHGVFRYNDEFYYAYKAEIHDIEQYNPYQKRWELFEDRFWGYPCMIQREYSADRKHSITKSMLWLVENIFDNENDAVEHMKHVEENSGGMVLNAFWEDIIGTG